MCLRPRNETWYLRIDVPTNQIHTNLRSLQFYSGRLYSGRNLTIPSEITSYIETKAVSTVFRIISPTLLWNMYTKMYAPTARNDDDADNLAQFRTYTAMYKTRNLIFESHKDAEYNGFKSSLDLGLLREKLLVSRILGPSRPVLESCHC